MDRAELSALLAGENLDTYRARELSAQIADNQQKLAELASANGFGGPGNRGGCGGPRNGRGGCGGGCSGAANNATDQGAGGKVTCGSPSCPNTAAAQ